MEVDTSSSSSASHPRRPPAHRSVSLRHHADRQVRARSHEQESGPAAVPPPVTKRPSSSPSSLKPLIGKDDSGESSNADKWFEKSNNNASRNGTSYVDNSPPFFLQHSSSDETPLDGAALARHRFLALPASNSSLPLRAGLLQLGTDNSSTEDFRSVIDDLTIENKKLKRKLRTYEKVQDSHLKDQKLFEVRVHGLPTQKKRELEEVLRKFAMGLSTPQVNDTPSSVYNTLPPTMPSMPQNKSDSSSATNHLTDSAYHSNSASGHGSSSSDTRHKHSAVANTRSRHQNIQTYLHDIPEGLLPRHAAAMTEKTKKKLVVRRLEHIFAGKTAGKGGNQQPQQQQEVSQQAATIDRRAIEEGGSTVPREGLREANIMTEASSATKEATDAGSAARDFGKKTQEHGHKSYKAQKLEQRPTRPLDLDPFRAQIPADNFDYIRHLGFSPPGADAMIAPADGHGWIYLNLLSNMAQLHTINVTGEFVRKAVQEYSKKFELSSDGRKIRWLGGKSITRHSTDGDETPSVGASGSNPMSSDRGSPRKRLKTSLQGSSSIGSGLQVDRTENKLAYTPLFHHRSSNDSDDESSEAEDTNESAFPFPQAGDSSGMTSSGIKTTSTKKNKQRENGPIIFYNNAKFCTDLSGDAKTEEAMMYNAFLYHNVIQHPVGTPVSGSTSPHSSLARGPLASAQQLPEAMDLDDNPIPLEMELDFPKTAPLESDASRRSKPVEFEVSGLGGVCPADNFTINVESRHAPIDDSSAPQESRRKHPPRYPANIAHVLSDDQAATSRKARPAFHKEIVATNHVELPPSQLPDASRYMPDGDTSPEDDDADGSDHEDAMSDIPGSPDAPAPATAPQRMEFDYSSDESSDEYDDDSDSDGSLDLLATARELDPVAVRAREREYDANMAERLAEEIPAGSSAATAGGGSGYASPASGVDRAEWEQARKEAHRLRKEGKESAEKKAEGVKRRRSQGRVHNE